MIWFPLLVRSICLGQILNPHCSRPPNSNEYVLEWIRTVWITSPAVNTLHSTTGDKEKIIWQQIPIAVGNKLVWHPFCLGNFTYAKSMLFHSIHTYQQWWLQYQIYQLNSAGLLSQFYPGFHNKQDRKKCTGISHLCLMIMIHVYTTCYHLLSMQHLFSTVNTSETIQKIMRFWLKIFALGLKLGPVKLMEYIAIVSLHEHLFTSHLWHGLQ